MKKIKRMLNLQQIPFLNLNNWHLHYVTKFSFSKVLSIGESCQVMLDCVGLGCVTLSYDLIGWVM